MDYIEASQLLENPQYPKPMSTGSQELDGLLDGGIHRSLFYHFYGPRPLLEILFRHLTINALKPSSKERPKVAYMLLNNYRKERANLGIEELAELAEDSGFNIWESMNRIRIFTASSADQQALLAEELEKFLNSEEDVNLVLVDGIFKLHHDDARKRERHRVREEVQRSITRLRQLCMERGIAIVSSGRQTAKLGKLIPQPESSSFLRHTANVIVYLRARQQGSLYNRAFLLDHPLRGPGSVEYRFRVDETLGRETKPFRQSFQEVVERLRREVKNPLVDVDRKKAFDQHLEAWASELGAMSYAESFKVLDLMLIISVLDNRKKLEEANLKIKQLENKLNELNNF
jgi:BMFP domain-containing protein YqiC/RecA/RadA recombinase